MLLVLSCSLWQVSQAAPVVNEGSITDACVLKAWTLLQNITHALTQRNLFRGIDCTKQSLELNVKTNTESVCAPTKSTCFGAAESKFNQESCLTNIGEDLLHYYKFLATQPDPNSILGPTVLLSLRELMENCFSWTWPTDVATEPASAHPSSYNERLSLCKVLKGFHLRTITINRVMGYMNSGDHTE
ncbi:interleukin-12 subunit alpha-like [Channa argus]|uniref:interleukin-12 subunit alpha-like n=1 Tax=Channa argus TaxID=215402 RepID=UPI0035208458